MFTEFVFGNKMNRTSTLSDIIIGEARFHHHMVLNSRAIVPSASPINVYSPSLHQAGFRWKKTEIGKIRCVV